jgi:hypothetical protein
MQPIDAKQLKNNAIIKAKPLKNIFSFSLRERNFFIL